MAITICKRKQSKDGKISLYPEYYHGIINGKYKRTYEYLNLYLIDPPKIATIYAKKMIKIAIGGDW